MRQEPRLALTFDDVLLQPSYSDVLPSKVDIASYFTAQLRLHIPLVSAAMDTVTDSQLAIALAQLGGIGVIHKSMSIANQVAQVKKVKKYESGVVRDPITINADSSIAEVFRVVEHNNISGLPVIHRESGELAGIVTNRDRRFVTDVSANVASIMTPREKLVTVVEDESFDKAQKLMHAHRIEKVVVVDKNNPALLRGLITVKDIQRSKDYPLASKDPRGQLLVAAAVGVGNNALERADTLISAGVDAIVIDTAHGHSSGVLQTIEALRDKWSQVQIIAGNIATGQAAKALASAGANAVKVGIGPGSICTTRMVAGVGMPQITAIMEVADAVSDQQVAVIADGGIRFSGDIAKAIAAGAHCVMLGGVFAGTDEAPGEIELYQGRAYKNYRGMGSIAAMNSGSADRYFQQTQKSEKLVPEGIEGRVPAKGPLQGVVHQLVGGLRASMGYTGCSNVDQLRNTVTMVRMSAAGVRESHVHDVQIVRESPNYHI